MNRRRSALATTQDEPASKRLCRLLVGSDLVELVMQKLKVYRSIVYSCPYLYSPR